MKLLIAILILSSTAQAEWKSIGRPIKKYIDIPPIGVIGTLTHNLYSIRMLQKGHSVECVMNIHFNEKEIITKIESVGECPESFNE